MITLPQIIAQLKEDLFEAQQEADQQIGRPTLILKDINVTIKVSATDDTKAGGKIKIFVVDAEASKNIKSELTHEVKLTLTTEAPVRMGSTRSASTRGGRKKI